MVNNVLAPDVSMMLIQIPKVGTVPKFEKYFSTYNSPPPNFCNKYSVYKVAIR